MTIQKNIKNYTLLDIGLIKWSAMLFALFIVSALPVFGEWVIETHWIWFLGICLLFALKPTITTFSKSHKKR